MSSNDIAIKAENLSKIYRIGIKGQIHDSLGATIFSFIKSPLDNYRKYRSLYKFDDIDSENSQGQNTNHSDIIWALKDVSFDVKVGEALGIIGKNGSGKSTLLKILCRITDPTNGTAELRGRVSSLLEVGTGFHPELTGKENIYLNGTILGMTKKEIDLKLDQIVDFSGVEKFIETPVKRYSSGMRVRLAFSVAAHLEPEILIIDEVLAVGDADFQKKCLTKMEEAGKEGRTVLFVSHNMPAVTRLCNRAILLDQGKMIEDGPAANVVKNYLISDVGIPAAREWLDITTAPSGKFSRMLAVRVKTENDEYADRIDIRHSFGIEMLWEVIEPAYELAPHFGLLNESGELVFVTIDLDPDWRKKKRPVGRFASTAWVPGNLLSEGMLYVDCYVYNNTLNREDCNAQQAIAFQVVDTFDGDSARGDYGQSYPGAVRPLLKWTTEFEPAG